MLLRALSAFLKLELKFEPRDLKPASLSSSLYNGRRTDVLYDVKNSFLVFVEHQSTVNPNMPVRFLEYFVEVLKKLPYERAKYGSKPLEVSDAIFINLYNGKEKTDSVYISCLSDLIKDKVFKDISLELKVFNINLTSLENEGFLKMCPILEAYVLFVMEAERELARDREKGLDIAIDNCIKKGILSKYLKENRSGIMGLFFGEYDQNIALEVAREESYDKGVKDGEKRGERRGERRGRMEGIREGYKNTAKNLLTMGLSIQEIAKATGLSMCEIEKL